MDEESYLFTRQGLDAMGRIADAMEQIAKALQVPAEIEVRLSGIEAMCAEILTRRKEDEG